MDGRIQLVQAGKAAPRQSKGFLGVETQVCAVDDLDWVGDRTGIQLEGVLSPGHPWLITKNLRCSPPLQLRALGATPAFQSSLRRGRKEMKAQTRSDSLRVTHLYSSPFFFFPLLPCPKRSSKAGIWDSPTSRFLLAEALLTAKNQASGKMETGPHPHPSGVICHAASEISQALLG